MTDKDKKERNKKDKKR